MQAQTAECLVVGELTTDKMVVVLNKIDLLPEGNRDKLTAKAAKMLLKTFAFTKFKSPPIVALSAKSGMATMSVLPMQACHMCTHMLLPSAVRLL